ncbi:MAG: hypothetical protein WCP98_00705 [Actinomycetes bacterium]
MPARVALRVERQVIPAAEAADGVPSKTVMDVTENARTLKFAELGFEEE